MKVNFKKESTLKFVRVLTLVVVAIIFCSDPLFAQTQTSSKLNSFWTVFKNIFNVVFLIGMSYGVIKTVLAFIGKKDQGMEYLQYLIIAAIVWALFSLLMKDFGISSASGVGLN